MNENIQELVDAVEVLLREYDLAHAVDKPMLARLGNALKPFREEWQSETITEEDVGRLEDLMGGLLGDTERDPSGY